MASPDKVNRRHAHAPDNQAPGGSSPGQQGYSGEATVGDEGGAAGPEAFIDPTGTGREIDEDAVQAALERATYPEEP